MKITILASIGCQNLGDELILRNEIHHFREKYGSEAQISVMTYDIYERFFRDSAVQYYEYFPIGIRKVRNIWRNIRNFLRFLWEVKTSNLVVIGWGGLIFDHEVGNNISALKQWYRRVKVINFFRTKILFYGIGISIKNEKNLKYVEQIFKNADEIFVRDDYSKKLLQQLKISSQTIRDPVFSDNGEYQNGKKLLAETSTENFSIQDLKHINLKDKVVGLSLRAGFLSNQNIEDLIETIQEKWGKIIFLCHSLHPTNQKSNDEIFFKPFVNKYDIPIASSLSKTYNLYRKKQINMVIGMRLHSIILACVYNIPAVSISYGTKTEEVKKYL